jgi:hypothetical protein
VPVTASYSIPVQCIRNDVVVVQHSLSSSSAASSMSREIGRQNSKVVSANTMHVTWTDVQNTFDLGEKQRRKGGNKKELNSPGCGPCSLVVVGMATKHFSTVFVLTVKNKEVCPKLRAGLPVVLLK